MKHNNNLSLTIIILDSLSVKVYHGSDRDVDIKSLIDVDIVLTSYKV